MYKSLVDGKRQKFEDSIEHFKGELGKLRTGRATPALVEHILVNYYGTKTPLKQIASISVPEPRALMIQPWDRGSLGPIESALRESDLGLNPMNDGLAVRLVLPALNEERRRDLVKVLNHKAEEARIAIRSAREELWHEIQNAEKEGTLSEDDKFRGKEYLQEVVEGYNKMIDELRKKKEEEILTI